ncbi:MAG: ATP-dependent helicase [Flavobacteriales bacterium]|nr:ATP-dependent helicase [Flavobacteriales bacterium]
MVPLIDTRKWVPVGIEDLEASAWEVVRSRENTTVVAGPGAGKTELLAQRACYLLQTGLAPDPRRILAISFKRDAAKNLKERVSQRCNSEDSLRFDSYTFDAFAKGLLDRFYPALSETWRPTSDYEILLPRNRTFPDFLDSLGAPPPEIASKAQLQAVPRLSFEKNAILGRPLPPEGLDALNASTWAAATWWEDCLRRGDRSKLTFPMIGRLVELLVRTNPKICEALRATYSHVFLDEFQDTTHVQYDLTRTIFQASGSVLTAVGDHKQQIMRWAMALDEPFRMVEQDFDAERIHLVNNYRSSPTLIRIQHEIALSVDDNAEQSEPKGPPDLPEEDSVILDFSNSEDEAEYLAKFIGSGISNDGLNPRDFVILVKQKASEYACELAPTFLESGVKVRDESEIQDTLAERLVADIISFLRLGSMSRAGKHWLDCNRIVLHLMGYNPEDSVEVMSVQERLSSFHSVLRRKMNTMPESEPQVRLVVESILRFLQEDRVKHAYPEYSQGNWYSQVSDKTIKYLFQSCKASADWESALDDLEGKNCVPLMTIHKSKGLEYHTVIFLALDDTAWWSFRSQPEEGRSTFFVAFSRAKQRVIFTYCEERGDRRKIASLYDILQSASVPSRSVS